MLRNFYRYLLSQWVITEGGDGCQKATRGAKIREHSAGWPEHGAGKWRNGNRLRQSRLRDYTPARQHATKPAARLSAHSTPASPLSPVPHASISSITGYTSHYSVRAMPPVQLKTTFTRPSGPHARVHSNGATNVGMPSFAPCCQPGCTRKLGSLAGPEAKENNRRQAGSAESSNCAPARAACQSSPDPPLSGPGAEPG